MASGASQPIAPRDGRSLRLFLVDGSPAGLITAELGNWTGKAVAAPRLALDELRKRKEANGPGVYLLMGAEPDEAEAGLESDESEAGAEPKEATPITRVYVGASDDVSRRLSEHDRDPSKAFFDRICVIGSKDENLTKTHVTYLEARIIGLVRSAAQVKLVNKTNPGDTVRLPEPDEADMERFLSEVGILLPIVGFDILPSTSGSSSTKESTSAYAPEGEATDRTTAPVFVFEMAGARATARIERNKFVVRAESQALVRETPTITNATKEHRKNLVENDALEARDRNTYRFTRDIEFRTPSAAASVVYGGNISGPINWRLQDDGRTYKEWRQRAGSAREDEE